MKRLLALFILFLLLAPQLTACTTAIVSGNYTVDGRPLLWKHRDSGFLQNKLVYFDDGDFNYIGLINTKDSLAQEIWSGFNSAGFAIMNSASYNLNTNDTIRLKDREGFLMKKALQSCASLADFEQLLSSVPKPLGVEANFGVIDANGGAAYYETNHYSFQKIDVNDPKLAPFGYIIRTNYSFTVTSDAGYGYIRFLTTENLFYQAAATNQLSLKFILQNGSRCLKHSLTQIDLATPEQYSDSHQQFVCLRDFIPRSSSVATTVVQGIKSGESPEFTTMWTILGFQLCSVAIPTWIKGGHELPAILTAPPNKNAPLCSWALKLKEQCFPIKRGSGSSYINIAALLNKENKGILQKAIPIENEILVAGNEKLEQWRQKGMSTQKIIEFYKWLDSKVTQEYRQQFNVGE